MTILLLSAALGGCQTPDKPLHTVAHVDLPRFMGDWYVIANIPTFIERDAHNAVESYRLAEDGRILTEFTFNAGAFDGPLKRYTPTGYVQDAAGAVRGMQFFWPIKADYRVIYLAPDYSQTIIGREKRDYVWIMARRPRISGFRGGAASVPDRDAIIAAGAEVVGTDIPAGVERIRSALLSV